MLGGRRPGTHYEHMVPCSCQNAHLHAAAKDRFCFRWIVWLHAAGYSFIFNTPERLDWKAPFSFVFLYIIMFIIITFPTFLQHHLLLIPLQHCAETVSYITGSLFIIIIIIIPVQANHDTDHSWILKKYEKQKHVWFSGNSVIMFRLPGRSKWNMRRVYRAIF